MTGKKTTINIVDTLINDLSDRDPTVNLILENIFLNFCLRNELILPEEIKILSFNFLSKFFSDENSIKVLILNRDLIDSLLNAYAGDLSSRLGNMNRNLVGSSRAFRSSSVLSAKNKYPELKLKTSDNQALIEQDLLQFKIECEEFKKTKETTQEKAQEIIYEEFLSLEQILMELKLENNYKLRPLSDEKLDNKAHLPKTLFSTAALNTLTLAFISGKKESFLAAKEILAPKLKSTTYLDELDKVFTLYCSESIFKQKFYDMFKELQERLDTPLAFFSQGKNDAKLEILNKLENKIRNSYVIDYKITALAIFQIFKNEPDLQECFRKNLFNGGKGCLTKEAKTQFNNYTLLVVEEIGKICAEEMANFKIIVSPKI